MESEDAIFSFGLYADVCILHLCVFLSAPSFSFLFVLSFSLLSLTLQLLGESSWSLSPVEALPASKITPIYYLFECGIRATVINAIIDSVLWLNNPQCPSQFPVESSGEFFKALWHVDQQSKSHYQLKIIIESHIFRSWNRTMFAVFGWKLILKITQLFSLFSLEFSVWHSCT